MKNLTPYFVIVCSMGLVLPGLLGRPGVVSHLAAGAIGMGLGCVVMMAAVDCFLLRGAP